MKIVCISDTHLQHDFEVPDGDMLIHSGDATWTGKEKEVIEFSKWFGSFPHKHKIFVAGNHDWGFELDREYYTNLLPKDVFYLQDTGRGIEGIRVWGSPWTPEFMNWAFNKKRGQSIASKWKLIPDNIDILITHGPPYGILDDAMYSGPVGCKDLLNAVHRVKPMYHIFGHVHEGYGVKYSTHCRTVFVNASICNQYYVPINKPIVIDI
jgi:Icc-related predicted phosphoesterase